MVFGYSFPIFLKISIHSLLTSDIFALSVFTGPFSSANIYTFIQFLKILKFSTPFRFASTFLHLTAKLQRNLSLVLSLEID